MKRLALIFAGLLLGVTVYAQKHSGFVLEGELTGLKDGTLLYLWHVPEKDKFDTIGRSVANGGKFRFSGRIPLEGALYHITIDTTVVKYEHTIQGPINLQLENKHVTLKGSISNLSLHHIMTTGLEGQDYYKRFKVYEDSMVAVANAVEKRPIDGPNDSISNVRHQREIDSIHLVFVGTMRNWAREHLNSIMSPWVLMVFYRDSVDYLRTVYKQMPSRIQNGKYGRDLKEILTIADATKVGGYAPDFRLQNSNGSVLSLGDFTAGGKLTLLVFWASWCSPCREEVPELKRVYAEYHKKGLSILGYSVDESADSWRKAIKDDSLPWVNVRDTDELASKLYGVRGIPIVYLLGSDRKVIQRNVQSENLEKTISDLLK